MAGDAVRRRRRQRGPGRPRPAVTALAGEPLVGTGQGEAGPRRVVEAPGGPGVRVVAALTGLPELPLVAVVVGMAGTAARLRVPVGRRRVTGLAGGDRVHAEQRKAGEVVVEADLLPPAGLTVAAAAIAALLTAVGVVGPMAGHAVAGERLLVDRRSLFGTWSGVRCVAASDPGPPWHTPHWDGVAWKTPFE